MRGFVVFLSALIFALPAWGQQVPESCDADYYDVLKTQAEIQAQQDVEAAQRFIGRGASVLQYSCFMDVLVGIADNADFERDVMSGMDMLVVSPMQAYLSENYPGTSGGCGQMRALWTAAQCRNMDLNAFRDIAFWAGNDLRDCPDGGRDTDYTVALSVVQGRAGQSGNADVVDPLLNELESCGSPVPTGVPGPNGTAEMTCLAPGCYFNGSSCTR